MCRRAKSPKMPLERLAAVNPAINAVVAQMPEEALAAADKVDAELAAGRDPGPLAGVPVDSQGQYRPERSCNHQWTGPAKGSCCRIRQPGCREFQAIGCDYHRPNEHSGVFAEMVYPQRSAWPYAQSAQPRDHARRVVRRRGGRSGGRNRHNRSRIGYRRIHPLSGLCLRNTRNTADAWTDPGA